MTNPLCIYHANCADGFGAAWAVRHALGAGNVDFHPGVYQETPPDVTGRHVLMVDFSYKRDAIETMAEKALSILILDHHKSAAQDLEGYAMPVGGWHDHIIDRHMQDPTQDIFPKYIRAIFDMERSGAGLTWDYMTDGIEKRPALLDHIEDRDLWRFALEGTREIQAALFSHPYDFDLWDILMFGADTEDLRREGEAIERKHHKDIAELVKVCQRKNLIGGYVVPVASLPYTLTSDAGNLMCQPQEDSDGSSWVPPFAACYWDTPEGRVFSLRSHDEFGGMDVSEIAKLYGGGGHKNAAGFRVPFNLLAEDGSPRIQEAEAFGDERP